MFRKIIEDCFAELKGEDASECKDAFSYIWAVFASKRVKFHDGDIWMSWRQLSAELATIYNEWFGCCFTTDAFLNVINPNKPLGEDGTYDEALMQVNRHDSCIGIFKMKGGSEVRASSDTSVFSETNIITGEECFYKQGYERGNRVGSPERISATEYESVCYSAR